jgi:hypothetical protein
MNSSQSDNAFQGIGETEHRSKGEFWRYTYYCAQNSTRIG